jgi:predicted TIM-barrel fold metal-dependent hydrolase
MSEQGHPLRFLDVNCLVGPYYNPGPGQDWSVEALVRQMAALGIVEACPSATLGRDYAPDDANRWLAEHVPASERLHPAWTVAPHHTGECARPAELIEQLRGHRVPMLRLFLAPTGFWPRLELPLFAELFDVLDEHRIPVLVDHTDTALPSVTDLDALLRTWPHLPLILSVPKVVQHERLFYFLWERHRNFFVDLPGFQGLCSIDAVVTRFGPNRLVYGSRSPYFTPLQTMLQLIYSDVDESAKRAIAGETMRQMLREVRL